MSDLITTGTSGYLSGAIDTASTLIPNVSPISAKHPNGLAAAVIQLETILGSGVTLKGTLASLAARLAVQMTPAGVIIPAGVIWPYGGATVPTGFLLCDGTAHSRTIRADLFAAIGTTWGVGDGATTFNIPKGFNNTLIGAGTRTVVDTGTDTSVDLTADTLGVAFNNTKWITGMSVIFTLSSGTVTGLTSGNTYYVIRNNSTTIQLASTLANAQNGTQINLTAKSSPIWTVTHTDTSRSLGEYGGEESHAMTVTELLDHTHQISSLDSGAAGANPTLLAANNTVNQFTVSESRGGNLAMNNMQPFAAVNYIIKY